MFSPTRRQFFVNAGLAAAAFGLSSRLVVKASAATAEPARPFETYKVGDVEVTALYDGVWDRPYNADLIANASADDVKKALTDAGLTDAYLTLPIVVSILKIGDELIMVDSGTGGQLVPTAGQLMDGLKAAGIDAGKISKILISHFHPDHITGLMAKDTNAQIFPDAEILVSDVEFKWWTDPEVINKVPDDRKPLVKRIQATFPKWKNVTQVSGEKEVAKGLSFVEAPGHTPGHRAFLLASGNDQHMFSNDTMYMPALNVAHPDWHGIYDQDAIKAEESRRRLMDRIIAENMGLSGYHFPFPGYGKLAKDGADYVLNIEKM